MGSGGPNNWERFCKKLAMKSTSAPTIDFRRRKLRSIVFGTMRFSASENVKIRFDRRPENAAVPSKAQQQIYYAVYENLPTTYGDLLKTRMFRSPIILPSKPYACPKSSKRFPEAFGHDKGRIASA